MRSSRPTRSRSRSRIAPALLAGGVLTVVIATSGCSPIDVVDPDPIAAASSPDRTDSSILDALRREGWSIEESSGDDRVVRTELPSGPIRVRIVTTGERVRLRFLRGDESLSGTDPETVERRKEVRRALGRLSDRIAYFIESADLSAGPLPEDSDDRSDDTGTVGDETDDDREGPNATPRD